MPVQVSRSHLVLTVPDTVIALARSGFADGAALQRNGDGTASIAVPIDLPQRGSPARACVGVRDEARPDPVLIAALRKAHGMLERRDNRPWLVAAPTSPYERRILRLAFLAPDLQRDVLAGHQPAHFNLEFFMNSEMPIGWDAQRRMFGRAAV